MTRDRQKNQGDIILAHMQQGETITPLDALNRYGCLRLAARIEELRRRGFNIETDKSRGYATYSLITEPRQ